MPFDMKIVLETICDKNKFYEIMPDSAQSVLIGFGDIEGRVVGLISNQPLCADEGMSSEAEDKASSFIRFCNQF